MPRVIHYHLHFDDSSKQALAFLLDYVPVHFDSIEFSFAQEIDHASCCGLSLP